jgi:hypothetical protein
MHVPYYQGRPAWLIKAAMPGRAGTAAKSAAAAAPNGARRAARGQRRGRNPAPSQLRLQAPPPGWEAWASNWFTPPR